MKALAALGLALLLAGCVWSDDVQPKIDDVIRATVDKCQYAPTAQTVGAIIDASINTGGSVSGVIGIATMICHALEQQTTGLGALNGMPQICMGWGDDAECVPIEGEWKK